MYRARLIPSARTKPFVEQFHIYGHGIANGVSEETHLRRVLHETAGLIGILILEDDEPKAMAMIVPGPVEDSHFNGQGIICTHLAGSGLGLAGMRCLHRALRYIAKENDAQWYSMSHRVSKFEYRNRYFMIGDTP